MNPILILMFVVAWSALYLSLSERLSGQDLEYRAVRLDIKDFEVRSHGPGAEPCLSAYV